MFSGSPTSGLSPPPDKTFTRVAGSLDGTVALMAPSLGNQTLVPKLIEVVLKPKLLSGFGIFSARIGQLHP
jgi:hypothetical protein